MIIPALYDTIQYLERQKFDWSDGGKREEILFKDRCSALLFHPIMMAFWSDLVNKHHLEVKEAFTQLFARSKRGIVVSDLLTTFMSVMQFSTLPIHDREFNPMYVNAEIRSNIPPLYMEYFMPHNLLG